LSAYLDASFVVSLYGPDGNLQSAANAVNATASLLLVSELCEMEAANAFRLRVFRKEATPTEAQRSVESFDRDLIAGVMQRRALPRATFDRAHRLSIQQTAQLGIRGADLLHVAAALELGADAFFSFDIQQRKLATAVGLVLNPI
jgi:predicted nucleic acid-binding protein